MINTYEPSETFKQKGNFNHLNNRNFFNKCLNVVFRAFEYSRFLQLFNVG